MTFMAQSMETTAPGRSLISSQPSSAIQSSAAVIGIVPPAIHSLLQQPSTSLCGQLDQDSSGLSHLISAKNEIHIWEHSIQTQNEELLAPAHSLTLCHPEPEGQLRVITVSLKPNIYHVYASSTQGVICLWIIDESLRTRNSGECDACCRLFPETSDEVITALHALDEWVMVSTSLGNVYKLHTTLRPLALHAKEITHEPYDGGIITGLYNKLFTPKKTTEPDDIVAMVPYYENVTAGGRTPPRSKVAKTCRNCHVITYSSTLNLIQWKVSLSNHEDREGIVTKKKLFERDYYGVLNLEALGDNLEGYTDIELMSNLVVRDHSLLVVAKISSQDVSMTRVYVLRIALGGDEDLSVVDSVWLNRYAGEAISKGLECYGLVGGDADEGCVAYVGFGSPHGANGENFVTISAISFSAHEQQPRVKDLDIVKRSPPTQSLLIPSIVSGCMSYDSTTGGCVFLGSSGLLGGTSVWFPGMTSKESSLQENDVMDVVEKDNVLAIKAHLISAFRQFFNKLRGGSGTANHAAIARSVVPPSIDSCSSSVLTAAVVMTSQEFLTNDVGLNGFMFPSFKKASPIAALRDKLQLHTEFVNFLTYAGAYRKVNTGGRISLRDHGEMIDATKTCYSVCQEMIEKLFATSQKLEEASKIRHVLNEALDGAADNVVHLPSRWASLQEKSTDSLELFEIICVMICNGIGSAFQYRQDSSTLYNIPSYEISAELSSAPWTSSLDVLRVLQVQLEKVDQSSFLDNATNLDEDLRSFVEDMTAALLAGHRDIVLRDESNSSACQMYENSKQLCIPLLRRFANDNDNVALESSLEHKYFEGIVQICHDHRKSWMHHGEFSDKQPDKTYDLRLMMSPDNIHNLKNCVDFGTNLNFCSYVLRWYADKNMKSKVFELGKLCPEELNQLVQTDRSFQELSWINNVRSDSYQDARDILLNNACTDLWEKEASLSLAKLTNMLSLSMTGSGNDHIHEIENGLTLISAQRMLQEGDSDSHYDVMSADELIVLATKKISLGADIEEVKQFAICGLEVAATLPASQRNDNITGAAVVWEAVIQAELTKWKSVLQESSKSVAGIPDNVLKKCEKTVFVSVCSAVAAADDTRLQSVGYLHNPAVRDRINQSMGLDESMETLFMSSAQVACS